MTRLLVLAIIVLAAGSSAYAQTGTLSGRVVTPDGAPLSGVTIVERPGEATAISGDDGRFVIGRVAAGPHTLDLVLGTNVATRDVAVAAGETADVEVSVEWSLGFVETITVTAASRRTERLIESPSAASTITADEIDRQAGHQQVPRLLAFLPGSQVIQTGLYDFSFNTRGFNAPINRRVLTLIDGRDPSVPVSFGHQEWAAGPFAMDEIEKVEVVRGPAAALYGAGAFNGVLNITTRAPRDAPGGHLRVGVGELATRSFSARHAALLDGPWSYKVTGSAERSGDFTRSRVTGVEYAPGTLPQEVVPLTTDRVDVLSGSARLDRNTATTRLSVEGGSTRARGFTSLTSAGRSQAGEVNRPWLRGSFGTPRWNAHAYYTGRLANELLNLSSGGLVFLSEASLGAEVQGNRDFAEGRGLFVGGASWGRQSVDSGDPGGVQTVFDAPAAAQRGAVFGQVTWDFTPQLKAVGSLRWDASELHDARLSPRGAVVFSPVDGHSVRVNYSDAFQSPTLVEKHLLADVAPALDLSVLESALRPVTGGTALGFGAIRFLAVGNPELEVERITSLDLGYTGVLNGRTLLTAAFYRNWLADFTSNLTPRAGTPLGFIAAGVAPYAPPAGLSAAAAAAVIGALRDALPPALFASLSSGAGGAPAISLLTFTNVGTATAQGVEIGVTSVYGKWRGDASYNFFDFDIDEPMQGTVSANTPRHQISAGLSYVDARFDASIRARRVGGFDSVAGIFVGPVPSYGVADLSGNWKLHPQLSLGIDIANAFDNSHYEVFGGSLLERRTLLHLRYGW